MLHINTTETSEPKRIVGIKQIAAWCGIDPSTVWRRRKAGKINIYGEKKDQWALVSDLPPQAIEVIPQSVKV